MTAPEMSVPKVTRTDPEVPFVRQEATPRRDPFVEGEWVRLRVEVRPLHQVVEGHVLPRGVCDLVVHQSRVAAVEALVETEEDRENLARARRHVDEQLVKWDERGFKRDQFPGSVEAAFYKITGGREPRPLLSCKVLERGIERERSKLEEQQALAANAHAEALHPLVEGLGALLEQMREERREQLAELRDLRAQLAEQGGKKR